MTKVMFKSCLFSLQKACLVFYNEFVNETKAIMKLVFKH